MGQCEHLTGLPVNAWDLDGVLEIGSFPDPTEGLNRLVGSKSLPNISGYLLELFEPLALKFFAHCHLDPNAEEVLLRSKQAGHANVINTSRPERENWVRLTRKQLAPVMDLIDDIRYCSENPRIKPAESKTKVIQALRTKSPMVRQIEDNYFTAREMKEKCRDDHGIEIVLIRTPFNRSLIDHRRCPGIRVRSLLTASQ